MSATADDLLKAVRRGLCLNCGERIVVEIKRDSFGGVHAFVHGERDSELSLALAVALDEAVTQ